jgi:hypothetical protein
MTKPKFTGGCRCGAVRYEAEGEPIYAGYCFCEDCRRSSGSGFAPFMGFAAAAVRFEGATDRSVATSIRGSDAVRNFCPACHSLVFGGIVGEDDQHTIYAGTLDDPSLFKPQMAIFGRDRPAWALLPPGVTVFETMPEGATAG